MVEEEPYERRINSFLLGTGARLFAGGVRAQLGEETQSEFTPKANSSPPPRPPPIVMPDGVIPCFQRTRAGLVMAGVCVFVCGIRCADLSVGKQNVK